MPQIFEFNAKGNPCPICNYGTMKDACLLPVIGSGALPEGQQTETIQVHIECLIAKSEYFENSSLILTPCHGYES